MQRHAGSATYRLGLTVAVALLAASWQAPGRVVPANEPGTTATSAIASVFRGRVIGPDGAPAGGAVVVTSAGGQAVSGPDGRFALEVLLPPEAESVHVTAVAHGARGARAAHELVGAVVHGGCTELGDLALAEGQACSPGWLPTFGGQPGASNDVRTLAVYDDGSGAGPALYVGGRFGHVGAVESRLIARWDGSAWSPVGDGVVGGSGVFALAVHDDGSGAGPALYAGGDFNVAGGVTASSIARWDGSSWSALGTGVGSFSDSVYALAVYDDDGGGGPALYVGGDFDTAGGAPASCIARWDGSNWSALGSGLGGISFPVVGALTVHDDGSGAGPALFAGGSFSTAGGLDASRVAKWDGSSWSPLGSGVVGSVHALQAFDDGTGAALYVGGEFAMAGGVAANRVAKWDGSDWSPVGGGVDDIVLALSVFDDGGGPALYAGGRFSMADTAPANCVAKWDGSVWSALASGLSGGPTPGVRVLAAFDDGGGGGPTLYAGGSFQLAGGVGASEIASWDGAAWNWLGDAGVSDLVHALAVHDDGSGGGPALYAGGDFLSAGGVPASRIAKWDGSDWSPLGTGIGGLFASVYVLEVFDDGSGGGPVLIAGGDFFSAGGVAVNRIAQWDGSTWSPLGSGVSGPDGPYATAVFDDGNGPALYVGGPIGSAGGVPVNRIAKWDGSSWSALGSGVGGLPDTWVSAMAVFDDGGGPDLYVAGQFTSAGGVPAERIARWDGTTWSPVGGGLDGPSVNVNAMTVYDDGGGPELYVGGSFSMAGSLPVEDVAKWSGASWGALGSGVNFAVFAMTVFDDGSGGGEDLCVAGIFTTAGGVAATRIARWNGTAWSPLGSGFGASVRSLAVLHDARSDEQTLVAGGTFSVAIDSMDSYLAAWTGCPVGSGVWADLGSGLEGQFGVPDLVGAGTLVPGSPGSVELHDTRRFAPAGLFVSFSSAPAAFKGGTLVPVPVTLSLLLTTDGVGSIPLGWSSWPAGIPPASTLYFQYAIADSVAVQGVSLSNALVATTP